MKEKEFTSKCMHCGYEQVVNVFLLPEEERNALLVWLCKRCDSPNETEFAKLKEE